MTLTSSMRAKSFSSKQISPGSHAAGKHPVTAALILAAGESRRMGSPKPLLTLGNETVLERSVNLFLNAGVESILVVTGCHGEIIRGRLPNLPVQWVHNDQFRQGMLSSIKKGIKKISSEQTWFFLLPVDIPLVRSQTISTLLKARLDSEAGGFIFHPTFMGERGHPPLIHTSHIPDILAWNAPGGLRAFLENHDGCAQEIPVIDEFIGKDMDTPADYAALSAALVRRHIPSGAECAAMLKEPSLFPEKTAAHCRQVARLSVYLVKRLRDRGAPIDIDRVESSALLHDIAKGQPGHAVAGAALLSKYGFSGIADIVAAHVDIDVSEEDPLTDAEIVYLADKLVKGDSLTSLPDRFDRKLARYGHDPAARAAILKRRADAETIVRRIEHMTGKKFQEILDDFDRVVE